MALNYRNLSYKLFSLLHKHQAYNTLIFSYKNDNLMITHLTAFDDKINSKLSLQKKNIV